MKSYVGVGLLLTAAWGGSAAARDRDAPQPAIVTALAECRAIADDAARLRCFDAAAGAFAAAIDRKAVVVVDAEQVQEQRREQFGERKSLDLPVPAGTVGDEIDQIDGTVRSAQQMRDGTWSLTLQDGSVWRQTDDNPFGREPRAGDTVLVRRAALGTFKLKVANMPAIRVRRVR
ncbi:hypothetical protein [Sphingomonas sp.]|jgi:hypothetical protein|uniref:hypothetical protein n=1 Tax=Sphingomonas sp. TaxID=28214 RepID=UPI0035C87774